MKDYKVQKLVEWLLTNSIICKNTSYRVAEYCKDIMCNTYEVNELQADIEDGVVWFTEERINFIIASIKEIINCNDKFVISFDNERHIDIELMQ